MPRAIGWKFLGIVLFQLLILAGMVGTHQVVLARGRTIVLETVPVDPRDLFRGDYVVLEYTVSTLDLNGVEDRTHGKLTKGKRAYVVLQPRFEKGREAWLPVAVFPRPPTGDELLDFGRRALFLEGKVTGRGGGRARLKYGIESYFVPEGRGHELERAPRGALTVEVSVTPSGRSTIRRALLKGRPWN
jgi:uncharacterized membrane-anchored protein